MRVRRACTRARRPSTPVGGLAAIAAVVVLATSPEAVASPQTTGDGLAASVASASTRTTSGIRVSNVAIPTVDGNGTASVGEIASLPESAGALSAHLRLPRVAAFSMIGVTWRHAETATPVTVVVRTRTADGWGRWTTLETDRDGGPIDAANGGAFRDGTEPDWVGPATGVEVAVYSRTGAPVGLDVSLIDPGDSPADLTAAAKSGGQVTGEPGSFPRIPDVITRKQWGADESLGDECWDPKYGRTSKAVIVHHTAGSNDYTRAESAAIVRGVYAYHTQSRGWCDIGYNFLVDRFGKVYEGRDGGIRRPVRGAHAGDYNTNTTGISLMGNFDVAYPSRAMKRTLISLVAWRLGTFYHHAFGRPFVFDRKIDRISGHRDVMSTACPGQHVYDWLPRLRHKVNERLGDWSSPIERQWQSAGGKQSPLGPVKIGELARAGGRRTVFADGRMYSSAHGVHALYKGPILDRYLEWGEAGGSLGYPTTGQKTVADGPGTRVAFEGGRIYRSKGTGANAIRSGAILHKYLTLRGAAGRLGFPRTEVVDRDAFAVARFQHGSITYDRATHATTVEFR